MYSIMDRIRLSSDETLLDSLTKDSAEYTEEYLKYAKIELEKRKSSSEIMKQLSDLSDDALLDSLTKDSEQKTEEYLNCVKIEVENRKQKEDEINKDYIELYEIKNIAICVILGIITFGIYTMIWQYSIVKKIKLLNNDTSSCVGEFLCLIFVPFYSFYWVYTRAKKLSDGAKIYGITTKDNGAVYLICVFLGFGIVAFALIQNDLNTIATQLSTGATQVSNNQPPTASPQSDDNFIKLKQLSELHKQGILTDEEYEGKKKTLLDRI